MRISFCVSLSSEIVGLRAAFLTSSRRVGMLLLVRMLDCLETMDDCLPAAVVTHGVLDERTMSLRGKKRETE
jgi:hypothetical protein